MDDSDVIVSSTEIIKDRLYFATLKEGFKPKATKNSKYFHIEDEIIYENFYLDFGPYHLCHLYQFCLRLRSELAKHPNKKVVFYSSNDESLRLNAAYLIGCYQIIYLQKSAEVVHKELTEGSHWSLMGFRDASGGPPLFDISLLDVFRGLERAHRANFFDFQHFNDEEYLFYEKVENGDLNWIVPQKMMAFSGPHQRSRLDRGYPLHSPEHYHSYFKKHRVTTIVRLNKKSYDARQFTAHGFEHRDLFFVDGSVPSDVIVHRFNRIAEAAKGAVAVHCKAGLGRTGTLIGCYMMKHHAFTAREAIAWLRICRPGSVIGHQQWFLEKIQSRMQAEGELYRRLHNITSLPVFERGIYSDLPIPETNDANGNEKGQQKPVSLTTILNHKIAKMDNASDLNANETCDSENNITSVISKIRSTPTTMLPTKTIFTLKPHYMSPTNSIKNSSNTNLNVKVQPRINAAVKSNFNSKTSTFPPTRSASSTVKLTGNVKLQGKNSFHGQRANLARPIGFNGNSPLKSYMRKTTQKSSQQETSVTTTLSSVTSTLSALTENCHLNAKNRLTSEPILNSKVALNTNINTRKKIIARSNSNSRKKLPKNNVKSTLDTSNHELSSSDTNITNISADSLENPIRFRRKRDKSLSPEPMDCMSNSVITSDVTPENYEETTNSQGNKLYKIKALRKKCPNFLNKKDGIQTRSSSCAGVSGVKKK